MFGLSHWLPDLRRENQRGFTNASAFLETVRFMKFTLELRESDVVLLSRRLLGFAAIEKLQKGRTRQAAPLELCNLQRLHEILEGSGCLTDGLGAGAMLICVYGRARWYIHHVVLEEGRNGFLTLYTAEHKTSAIGANRERCHGCKGSSSKVECPKISAKTPVSQDNKRFEGRCANCEWFAALQAATVHVQQSAEVSVLQL